MQAIQMILSLAFLGFCVWALFRGAGIVGTWLNNTPALPRIGVFIATAAIANTFWPGWSMATGGLGFVCWTIGIAFCAGWLMRFGGGGYNADHVRGNTIVPLNTVLRILRGTPSRIKIGEVPLPVKAECEHILLSGATGTGKSQAFHQILRPARELGHRAIIPDVGGSFAERYYQPGDVILNPFDSRSTPWSPLAEMRDEWDAKRIANSMIPDGEGSSKEWNGYAQGVLSAVLARVWESGCGTNAELCRLLLTAPQAELKQVVSGTSAGRLFEDGNDRMLASVLSIVSTYVSPLTRLNPEAGSDAFSLRDWIDGDGKNWVFFNFTDSQFAELKPLVAASIDIAVSQTLDLPESETRRIWFSLDEFATFGRINSISDALTKIRKKGGCVVMGLQSISQVREAYGREGAQTLLANLGTWLVLRAGDAETADYMSRYIGDEDVRRETVSTSSRGFEAATTNTGSEYRTQRAVLPSEISQLESRVGILNIVNATGVIPPCVVQIPIDKHPKVAAAYEPKPREKRLMQSAEPAAEAA